MSHHHLFPDSDPFQRLAETYDRIEERAGVWISVVPREHARAMLAHALERQQAGESLPLCGLTFGIKDNIDLAGMPTTAGCPDFAYMPPASAPAVQRLIAAGAIPVGKTNLDQFAAGLNGTRTPYAIPSSVFDPRRVSGGSSSGSAVAVAAGLVSFALGTDTAGSGRVPAAFNNLVGLKPTRGLVSARGVVPACRSLDCVSVFANTATEALDVLRVIAAFDPDDAFSRRGPETALCPGPQPSAFRFGVPDESTLGSCSTEALALFEAAARRLERLGGTRVAFDYAPFRDAAGLLYSGPWVAERLAAIQAFITERPDSVHPVVREVILTARGYSATDVFQAQYQLAELTRLTEPVWAGMDVMLLPTAPFVPEIAAMQADPIGLNSALGVFTNFVNLMDLAAIAVPAGFTADGLPFGVTLVGPAFTDGALALLGDRLHRMLANATLGASDRPLATVRPVEPGPAHATTLVAVVGAHLSGQPLNAQLVDRGGKLVQTTRTASGYSLYALPGTSPPKPGLVRDGGAGGIEVEIWHLPLAGFGALVADIPPPLGIGTLAMADGTTVQGFLCEAQAVPGAEDITHLGGWRAFLRQAPPTVPKESSR